MTVAWGIVVAVVVLSGCTRVLDISGTEWQRANTSIQQETFDEVECARETEGRGNVGETYVGGIIDAIVVPLEDRRRGEAYDRCMVAKGYSPVTQATDQR